MFVGATLWGRPAVSPGSGHGFACGDGSQPSAVTLPPPRRARCPHRAAAPRDARGGIRRPGMAQRGAIRGSLPTAWAIVVPCGRPHRVAPTVVLLRRRNASINPNLNNRAFVYKLIASGHAAFRGTPGGAFLFFRKKYQNHENRAVVLKILNCILHSDTLSYRIKIVYFIL